jgi:hypothetical protein
LWTWFWTWSRDSRLSMRLYVQVDFSRTQTYVRSSMEFPATLKPLLQKHVCIILLTKRYIWFMRQSTCNFFQPGPELLNLICRNDAQQFSCTKRWGRRRK